MSEIYLVHHGIKGQKWGVRRFQNEDGSVTPAGKARYYKSDGTLTRAGARRQARRNEYLERNRNRVADMENERANARRTLKDLEKNGVHGSAFKDEYGNYSNREFEEQYGMSKKAYLASSIAEARKEVERTSTEEYKKEIEGIKADIKKIENTPLDSDSFVEASNRGTTIATALYSAGAFGGFAVTMLTAGADAGLGTLAGSVAGGAAAAAYMTKKNKKNVEKYGMSGYT